MTTVMKVQLNMFINREVNLSISFEHIVTDEQDARDLGAADKKLFNAYMEGYGTAR